MKVTNTTKVLEGSPALRARLPYGAIQMIATKHGISWVWARRVIMGQESGDPAIIEDAIRLAERHESLKSVIYDRVTEDRTASMVLCKPDPRTTGNPETNRQRP